ncbi:MAG: amidohydrolase family protein, partial [Saprospiraceae bacterium]|nr:amidohydrolase family protein [Saprospiraceae bacterium]
LYAKDPAGMARPEHSAALQAFFPVLDGMLPVFFRVDEERSGFKTAYRVFTLQEELGFPLALAGLKHGWMLADKIKAENTLAFLALELPEVPKQEKKKEKEEEEEEGEEETEKEEVSAEVKELEARREEEMKKYESQAALFQEKGIAFGFASLDAKGQDIRGNLRRMISAGLSEEAALAALTTDAAKALGVDKMMGTIETGKIANLVITDKPYFEEKSNVRYVIVDGKVFEYEKGGAKKAASPDAVAAVVGTWNYKLDVPGQSMGGTIVISSNQGYLEGTVSNPQTQQTTQIQDAVLDGNNLRFVTRFDGGGQTMRVEWTLEIEGETFSGTVSAGEIGSFGVEAERVGGTPDDRQ